MAGLAEAAARVFASNRYTFQYALPSPKLKLAICRLMLDRGVECSPEQVFLTSGAQQGLSLLARLLLDPGAMVFEEALSYPGFQQSIDSYSPSVVTIPTRSTSGIDVDSLEQQLASGKRPALVYLMADGHNPLGVTMPFSNRQRLANLAREFRVPVIEDDPYGFLQYDGKGIPPIRALESEWIYYVGSFSKLLAPALRVGWLIVPVALIQTLGTIKEAADINMNTFTQWVVAEFLEMGGLPAHLAHVCQEYDIRRRAMQSALLTEFPEHCSWQMPGTGVFFWIDLPQSLNASDILQIALDREHVAFLPAEAFSRGKRSNGMRLNFSGCNTKLINEGVRRIATAMKY